MSDDYFAIYVEPPNIPHIPVVYVLRDEKWIKIGKTASWLPRWGMYVAHNPSIRFIAAWQERFGDECRTLFEAGRIVDNVGKARGSRDLEWFPAVPALVEWAQAKADLHGNWWDAWNQAKQREAHENFLKDVFKNMTVGEETKK
jgi:hypothetical protein